MLEAVQVQCPYCGETLEVDADLSAGEQRYVEDCQVCCRPIEFHLEVGINGELAALSVRRDDD